jgi:predicted GIY-YIG superfamily endonuclease
VLSFAGLDDKMFYVYIIKSRRDSEKLYIGYTIDIARRLKEHNQDSSNTYIRSYAPWKLETYISFSDLISAKRFENYLKSHSGRAFLHKRLVRKSSAKPGH